MENKTLKWYNGVRWGMVQKSGGGWVETFCRSGVDVDNAHDSYTVPVVEEDGSVYCEHFSHKEKKWKGTVWVCVYDEEEEIVLYG